MYLFSAEASLGRVSPGAVAHGVPPSRLKGPSINDVMQGFQFLPHPPPASYFITKI